MRGVRRSRAAAAALCLLGFLLFSYRCSVFNVQATVFGSRALRVFLHRLGALIGLMALAVERQG